MTLKKLPGWAGELMTGLWVIHTMDIRTGRSLLEECGCQAFSCAVASASRARILLILRPLKKR